MSTSDARCQCGEVAARRGEVGRKLVGEMWRAGWRGGAEQLVGAVGGVAAGPRTLLVVVFRLSHCSRS